MNEIIIMVQAMKPTKRNKDTDVMLNKFEGTSNTMISNIVGLPLLACRIAQVAATIKNNTNIKTEKECSEFLINDLVSYSKKLKDENCLGHMLIDKYIKTLKNTATNEGK